MLWEETVAEMDKLAVIAAARIEASRVQQGGGGAYPLLYFLTRLLKPSVVLETGVASGWTSAAILMGLKKNSAGVLHSTDLPYENRPGAFEAVGVVVESQLRDRWRLNIGADRDLLPQILETVGRVDIFHYDSDKSSGGRAWAIGLLRKPLGDNGILVVDDIQDNMQFRNLCRKARLPHYVFAFEGKFVGLTGNLNNKQWPKSLAT